MKNNDEQYYGSFLIMENDEIKNNKKNGKKKEKKTKFKEEKIKNESDDNAESVIILNPKNIKDNIYNDYCIFALNPKKRDKLKQKINSDFGFDFHYDRKLAKINTYNKNTIKRSDSSNYDDRSCSRFFDKKKKEFNNDFVILDDNNLKPPKPFNAECNLHDKSNNVFKGEIKVDQNYDVKFILNEKSEKKLYYNSNYYFFSLLLIKNYNSNTNYFGQINYSIEINLKDNRYFLFKFLLKNSYDEFIKILETYANPELNYSKSYFHYAYAYFESSIKKGKFMNENGWNIYNFEKELKRQKIDIKNKYYLIDNSKFSFCESYPEKIIVPRISGPKTIDDDLKNCADFRTKKRLPALTYKHENGVCIWRCSQSKSGFMSKNEKDKILLTKIADNKKLMVYDCRPYLNAWANKLKGAGFENTKNYDIKMDIKFCEIPNIHAVRYSFEKMYNNLSYNNDNEYPYSVISNLPNTLWYDTIITILKSSFNLYDSITKHNETVLIHCSDGWDRTSQLSCTSQILLDKYYRTLEGFIVLIEKDWLSFGHQFRYRSGFYSLNDTPSDITSENQFSPIFIQWLDCIYQLMNQNYTKFEFNPNLLTFIACELFNGKYGTFLFNNEKERGKYKAKTNTVSIWNVVLENKKDFLNPLYQKDNDKKIRINYKNIKLWREYFYRFEKGENEDLYRELYNKKNDSYDKEIVQKQKMIEEMAMIIKNSNVNLSLISNECLNELEKYNDGSKIGSSFEIIE